MTTRRDEAWHAVMCEATESGLDDTFGSDDVVARADEMGLDVAKRTIQKTLAVMVDFGYLGEPETGHYHMGESFVSAVAPHRGLDEAGGELNA